MNQPDPTPPSDAGIGVDPADNGGIPVASPTFLSGETFDFFDDLK